MKTCTLLLIVKNGQILLAMKKRGFGEGYWNGIGGKVEAGETIEEALVRECQEEIVVTPVQLEKVAEHDFLFPNGQADMKVHVYLCKEWEGEPTETEEMAPKWFNISEIPYNDMWEDDSIWLPFVLRGDKVKTTCTFTPSNKLVNASISVVDSLH